MSDIELQKSLADLATEQLYYDNSIDILYWNQPVMIMVKPTELLHVCWLIEQRLSSEERKSYLTKLWHTNPTAKRNDLYTFNQALLSNEIWWTLTNASWQQRVAALVIVKDKNRVIDGGMIENVTPTVT